MRQRYRASNKVKRDGWVKQMAEDMPQLTQEDIAKRFGLEQSTISRILKSPVEEKVERWQLHIDGKYTPQKKNISHLSKTLSMGQ